MLRELAGFIDSASKRGLSTSISLLASEFWFDVGAGTRTHSVLESAQLGLLPPDVDPGDLTYHAVNPRVFNACIDALIVESAGLLPEGAFVDFGSGKGRALILAARRGFTKLIGVECSAHLNDRCATNLRRCIDRRGNARSHELHLQNAATFRVPDDSSVWFWFNPFGPSVAARVADRLVESLQRRPREAWLLYVNPRHLSTLVERGFVVCHEVRLSPSHLDAVLVTYSGPDTDHGGTRP